MSKEWTDYEIDFLKSNYPYMKTNELSKILNRSESSIFNKVFKLGIKKEIRDNANMHKYSVNEDYFKIIDTPNKAYYLGWAITDGNYLKYNGQNQYRLRLQNKDQDILYKFLSDIESDTKVYARGNYCEVNICNREFVSNLEQFGFSNNKTRTIEYPNIPKEYNLDFIKGCFDGDGSYICTEKTHKISFVTASHNFFYSLIENLNSYDILTYPHISKTYYSFEISQKDSIKKFIELMLNTTSDFLNRKHTKMIELNNLYN